MGRLRVLSGREVCRILETQGFVEVLRRGSHIVMQQRIESGTITVPVPDHRELAIGTLQSIIRQSPDVHRELVQQSGFNPHVMGLSFCGFAHFCLGYPEQALAYVNAAIAEAQTEQHRPSTVQSLAIKARLLCFLGDAETLTECADQLSAIGIEQGFPYWRTTALIYRGWALALVGDFENGADLIRQGISAWQATGAITWLPFFQGLQAQAEAAHGQT